MFASVTDNSGAIRNVIVLQADPAKPRSAAPPTTTTTVVVTAEGSAEVASCQRREERVTIVNTGSTAINPRGWRLHDEDVNHSYTFGSVTIEPGGTIVVTTGPDNDADDPKEILWKRQHVWNNEGDTGLLLDPPGVTIDTRPC